MLRRCLCTVLMLHRCLCKVMRILQRPAKVSSDPCIKNMHIFYSLVEGILWGDFRFRRVANLMASMKDKFPN